MDKPQPNEPEPNKLQKLRKVVGKRRASTPDPVKEQGQERKDELVELRGD